MTVHDAAARGFERGADDYEAARPGYPPEVVDLLAEALELGPGRRVLDLAAGTGKLTRLLVPSGAEVVAVEPVAAMRATLADLAPEAEVLDGTAEAIPLPDAGVDAAVVAQAFHWFDAAAALAELARVLRPGGALALVWNVRDESVEWVRQFGELLVEGAAEDESSAAFRETGKPYDEGQNWADVIGASGRFGAVERATVSWEQPVDADLLVRRAASTSFVSALPDDTRAAALDRVRALAVTHPDLAGRATFGFPYRTAVYWCRRQP
ncbi:MAG: methyltransferase domain-containing protein [Acidimicrobiales bacterium]|nr:methyltransferase domain-containing protein [Acidimicrobiales bacterium]